VQEAVMEMLMVAVAVVEQVQQVVMVHHQLVEVVVMGLPHQLQAQA
jgi:hypothetical protein